MVICVCEKALGTLLKGFYEHHHRVCKKSGEKLQKILEIKYMSEIKTGRHL